MFRNFKSENTELDLYFFSWYKNFLKFLTWKIAIYRLFNVSFLFFHMSGFFGQRLSGLKYAV